MERDRCAARPVIGWLLGALVAFCALWPGTSGPVAATSAAGATALARPSASQHIEAVAAPLRPDIASTIHLIADAPAQRPDSVTLISSEAKAAELTTGNSTSLSSSDARAPPAVLS
jgi:hypothetical protein